MPGASPTVAVRASFRRARPVRSRRQAAERRRRRLALRRRSYRKGPVTLRVPFDRAAWRALAGRRQNLRLAVTVTVTDRDGDRMRVARTTLLKP